MANEIQDVQSYDIITNAIMDLLNTYAALYGKSVSFSDLDADYGYTMYPSSGAVIVSQIHDILGHTTQNCQYNFNVMYHVGSLREHQKITAKEWLDRLGRWLEKQPITVEETVTNNGTTTTQEVVYTLSEYPALTGNRKFTEIQRTSPATLTGIESNGVEQWSIGITARYVNEF